MVSAPPRPIVSPSAEERPCLAPVRVPLPDGALTWDDFLKLGEDNPGYRFECYGRNELVITLGGGRKSGVRAGLVATELNLWRRSGAGGDVAVSAGISEAEDGSWLIADASWMSDERGADSGGETGEGPGAVPDLIVEIVSWTDRASDQQRKMETWMGIGARLGWLIDPYDRIVWVYRPGRDPEQLHEPAELHGATELPGLVVPLAEVWAPIRRS